MHSPLSIRKQRAVGGALDQAGAGVEEVIGLPFQGDAAMGAAIAIEVGDAIPAHGQQFVPVDIKTTAAVGGEGVGGAEKLHSNP